MSLMAGFDLLIEISNQTIEELIRTQVQLAGTTMNPPFEINLSFAGGSAHLVAKDLWVDLNANDTLTISLPFENTNVVATSPLTLTACPLDGTLKITAPITLINPGGGIRQIAVQMGQAQIDILYSAAADQALAADLAGTGIPVGVFKQQVDNSLTTFIQNMGQLVMPMAFQVTPGQNGSINPLVFTALQVHCIPHATRSRQALGLFGTLLASNVGNGNASQKDPSIIKQFHEVAISISPTAFRRLVFCPAIANALGTDVASLPTACGNSGGLGIDGATVTHITDSFANGHIDINGGISKSGFCYDASGTFHAEMTFTMNSGNLIPNLSVDDPDVDVDIPWYCWLAVGVVLGPIGLIITGIVNAVAEGIAEDLASSAIGGALGNGLPQVSLGGLDNATFTSVDVTTQGLTLHGFVPIFVPASLNYASLTLNGSVTNSSKVSVGSGMVTLQPWCLPDPKVYPYTEYEQTQVGTYNLQSKMLATPLSVQYSVKYQNQTVPLVGNSGTVILNNVATKYPMPLPQGTEVVQNVHLNYSISGTQVQLYNVADEGNFTIYLSGQVSDCNGNSPNGAYPTVSKSVMFEGQNVFIGGGYQEDVAYCAQVLADMVKEINNKYILVDKFDFLKPWEPVNYPLPDGVLESIYILVAAGDPAMDEVLSLFKAAHGHSFVRALTSPEAQRFGLSKNRRVADVTQLRQQASQIEGQIALLQGQLQALNAQTAVAGALRGLQANIRAADLTEIAASIEKDMMRG